MNAPPYAWTVISPERSLSRHVEVLASVGDTILSIDDLYCIDQVRPSHPFPPLDLLIPFLAPRQRPLPTHPPFPRWSFPRTDHRLTNTLGRLG